MENLPKKVRSKKLSTRVDLTAMVSVSFLLIIFFMLVGELSKPKFMALSLPEKYSDDEWNGTTHCYMGVENRIITVLLDQNDKIVMYEGFLDFPEQSPKHVRFGKDEIRKELIQKQSSVREYSEKLGRPGGGVIVIIKPSKKCNFKNLVDILDEMTIAKIDTYAIVNEFTTEESKLLAVK
ncbi:biopolymer transporter ExbD [Flavobacterium sp. Root420]|uniref:ExbD/TolR family protein n=1 Tax=Flavobacterium sp. Root420 TaxID=1736533 RepID=UPI000700E50A|nr:biopolymer transporter ExbD [Flavobacterium sp. Root420]KQX00527.1 biopolymer transporter ExbD [Flavobacterium sp. Root420]